MPFSKRLSFQKVTQSTIVPLHKKRDGNNPSN